MFYNNIFFLIFLSKKMNNPDVSIQMIKILDKTNCSREMVDIINNVINVKGFLNPEERNLLSVSYKKVISVFRNGIQTLDEIISYQKESARIEQLNKFKKEIVDELEHTCLELIGNLDEKLLPNSKDDVEASLFYHKLKADYYRYISEAKDDGANLSAQKAKESYEMAFKVAENTPKFKPSFLGLVLNYSVFLFEIEKKKQEALELAEKTNEEASLIIDQNSEESKKEAISILQLLRENIDLWKQTNQENE